MPALLVGPDPCSRPLVSAASGYGLNFRSFGWCIRQPFCDLARFICVLPALQASPRTRSTSTSSRRTRRGRLASPSAGAPRGPSSVSTSQRSSAATVRPFKPQPALLFFVCNGGLSLLATEVDSCRQTSPQFPRLLLLPLRPFFSLGEAFFLFKGNPLQK